MNASASMIKIQGLYYSKKPKKINIYSNSPANKRCV
jgi:hypothetical protein